MSIQTKEKMVMWVKHNVEQSPSLEEMADYVDILHFTVRGNSKNLQG